MEKLEIQVDIVTYSINDGKAHEFDPLVFLALLTFYLPSSYEPVTRYYRGHQKGSGICLANKKQHEGREFYDFERYPDALVFIDRNSKWFAWFQSIAIAE